MTELMQLSADLARAQAFLGIPPDAIEEVLAEQAKTNRRETLIGLLQQETTAYDGVIRGWRWPALMAATALSEHEQTPEPEFKSSIITAIKVYAEQDGWPAVWECLAEAMRRGEAHRENLLDRR